jgi:hypothetical protein
MKADELIKEVYIKHRADLPDIYRWEDERDRLNELYYCLLLKISGRNEAEVRNIITSLANMNLFDVESLAEAKLVGGKGGKGDKIASLISELLVHNGFEDEMAKDCTLAICEVARGIHVDYQGKLQKFLRKHANLMIEELDKTFSFSKLTKHEERYFLVHWLQNALEMPVPLSNEFVEQFCKENGIELDDLVKASDKVDINVAFMDDLLKIDMLEKAK